MSLIQGSSIPFPKRGIKLIHFNDFIIKYCGGENVIQGWTTTDICEKIVKPLTLSSQSSYCDLLLNQGYNDIVMIGQVFISHAWKYVFLDVVNALMYHFRDNLDIIIWFDLFSNNQHKAVDLDFEWWCNTFKEAISDFKHVVLVLSPWQDPIPLTRAWCLFELYCSAITNCFFEVAMCESQQKEFLNDMSKDTIRGINRMLGKVNCKKSDSFNPKDKLRIFEVVEQSIGFEQINKMVFEQLRKWVIDTTYNALSIEINDDKKATLQMILAEIYRGQGLYSKSEELYLICLEKRLEIYGDMNEDTLKTMNGLGISLFSQCKYIEAEEKFIECLKKRKTLKGDANRETLQSLSNLAGLYLRQKKTKLAESLYLEVLTKRKVYLGEEDEDTLHSMNTLANTYVQLNKQNEAEILFMDVLQKYQNILGNDHPSTLQCMNNLGISIKNQYKFSEASIIFAQCLDKFKIVFGDDAPDTLSLMHNLGTTYFKENKFTEAENLLNECFIRRVKILGIEHESTKDTEKVLNRFYPGFFILL